MNKTQNDLLNEEIARRNGNLSQVSRILGLDYFALRQRQIGMPETFRPASGPEPTDIRSLGREGFKQYVVAVKKAGGSWPEKYDDVIKDARRKFDAGTHEMFQTSNEGWVVQYLIPYLIPVPRRQFFSNMIVIR